MHLLETVWGSIVEMSHILLVTYHFIMDQLPQSLTLRNTQTCWPALIVAGVIITSIRLLNQPRCQQSTAVNIYITKVIQMIQVKATLHWESLMANLSIRGRLDVIMKELCVLSLNDPGLLMVRQQGVHQRTEGSVPINGRWKGWSPQ